MNAETVRIESILLRIKIEGLVAVDIPPREVREHLLSLCRLVEALATRVDDLERRQ